MRWQAAWMAMIVGGVCLVTAAAQAQYSTVTAPMHNVGDNFFERNGVGFNFNLRGAAAANLLPDGGPSRVVGLGPNGVPGGNIQFRGVGPANPQFGGFNPAAANGGGFAISGRGGSASFNFFGDQGSSRSIGSTSPSITVSNGMGGFFSDVTQRPFVTSFTPVVGGWAGGDAGLGFRLPGTLPGAQTGATGLDERLSRLKTGEQTGVRGGAAASNKAEPDADAADNRVTTRLKAARENNAGIGSMSLKEIREAQSSRADSAQREAAMYYQRGLDAEASGKKHVAKTYFDMAARNATGTLKAEAEQRAAAALGGGTAAARPGAAPAAAKPADGKQPVSSAIQSKAGLTPFKKPAADPRGAR